MTQLSAVVSPGMDFTDDERDLMPAGTSKMPGKVERCNALATRLGRDREALYFGARI